jgi:YgiT-type zinc finger domain-containing protein
MGAPTMATRDYGPCVCGHGRYTVHMVEVRMTIDGEMVTLTDVPQGRCPACGTRVYKRGVLESIEALFRRSDRAASGS